MIFKEVIEQILFESGLNKKEFAKKNWLINLAYLSHRNVNLAPNQ